MRLEQRQRIQVIFSEMDTDNDGIISQAEFSRAETQTMQALTSILEIEGNVTSSEEIKLLFEDLAAGDSELTLTKLLSAGSLSTTATTTSTTSESSYVQDDPLAPEPASEGTLMGMGLPVAIAAIAGVTVVSIAFIAGGWWAARALLMAPRLEEAAALTKAVASNPYPPEGFTQHINVGGAESVAGRAMGDFTISLDTPPTRDHNGLPIYRNTTGEYLYYWAEQLRWVIGPDPHVGTGGIFSSPNTGTCPTSADCWHVETELGTNASHTLKVEHMNPEHAELHDEHIADGTDVTLQPGPAHTLQRSQFSL